MSIVVTAATGQLGRLVVDELLTRAAADRVVAVARNERKAARIAAKGVEVRIADYGKPETLKNVFGVCDVALLISGTEFGQRTAQHRNVIDAAKATGVARLTYTSVLGGLIEGGYKEAAEQHKPTEQAIVESGLTYTLLRNGWYTENYTAQIPGQLKHGVVGAAGEGKIGSATRADFAAAAAVVLTSGGHENKIYELSGDSAWSFAEYAAELSLQSGTEIAYRDVPVETLAAVFSRAGIPAEQAYNYAEIDLGIKRGLLQGGSGELSRLIGRPTTPLAETISAALKG
ncbi:SDR family oxidoreductase [Frankia sp. R82]|uniref:SDR family oxidoreductase n=1 Tax=Frankia sp. R82 TaxID=2950553 RepID=UPI0020448170|nr:SDR family oxidoreductase [Frankia sp. R82]MCM3887369.1 SDR family oxidoreductase [Frankia sp. R82]